MTGYPKNATLVYRKDLTHDLAIIRVRPDSGEIPPFTPGQYAELALPAPDQEYPQADSKPQKLIRRSYSIGSPPSIRDYIELYIVLVPGGALTPELWELKENDRLWMGPKIKGKFTLDEIPPAKDLIMVSTGTGLAPYRSMLLEYSGQNRWRRLVIIHGTRYARDLGYREEFEPLDKARADFLYLPIVTREAEDSTWKGARGRVTTLFESKVAFEKHLGFPLDPGKCHVLLCGNPAMIDSVQALLEQQDFQAHSKKNPGNLHFERYW